MTPQEVGRRVKEKYPQYKDMSDEEVGRKTLAKYPQYANETEKPKSFLSKISDSIKTRGGKIVDIAREKPSNFGDAAYQVGTKQLRMLGQAAGAIGDVAGAAVSGVAKTGFNALPAQGQQNLKSLGSGIANSAVGQAGARGINYGMQAYGGFKERNPRAAETVEAIGNVASVIPIGFGGKVAAKESLNLAEDALDVIKRVGTESIDNAVEKGISKGIRPSVVGKGSLAQLEGYKNKAKEAVVSIVRNKDNLSFTDEFGEVIAGRVPQSLRELTEAVDQTKKRIFSEYSALASKAGETGVAVDLNKVTSELGKIVNDKVIQTISPETVKYAENLIERFAKQGQFTPEQAQQAIANLNESLQSFYKNPSYGTYRQAQIDALIANNLRESLDSVITGAVGSGYSELKKAYGALKTIEKDAIKRAVVEGRKNAKGLIDFTDIFSAGDVIMGLSTGNIAQVAKGGIQKAVASYLKKMNSPDNSIKKMFESVERAIKNESGAFTPKSGTIKAVQSMKGKAGLSVQDVSGGKAGYADDLLSKARKYATPEELKPFIGNDGKITLYHGSNTAFDKSRADYGTFLTANRQEALDYARMRANGRGGSAKVSEIKLDPSEVRLNQSTGEFQYIGESKSLSGSKYPKEVYKAYNDVNGSNLTAKEIDNLSFDEVRGNASMGMENGKEEFDQLTDLWKKAHETKRGFGTGAGRPKNELKSAIQKADSEVETQLKGLKKDDFNEFNSSELINSIRKDLRKAKSLEEVKGLRLDVQMEIERVLKSRAKEYLKMEGVKELMRKAAKARSYEDFLKEIGREASKSLKQLFIDSKK